MTSKERFLKTLDGGKADRLPVTAHHLMPSFLDNYMNGISNQAFFDWLEIDPIDWVMAHSCSSEKGEYFDPNHFEADLNLIHAFADEANKCDY